MRPLPPELVSPLPPLFAGWIGEILQQPVPEEARATCLDCAMCNRDQREPAAQEVFFNPNTKCCTYHPDLPNFLAGRILADNSPAMQEGRRRLLSRLSGPAVVRPQGVFPSLEEGARHTVLNPNFGHDETMLCPYFLEDGLCGIWQHRNARCSTWFCKHTRGSVGRDFWRTLKTFLAAVEQHLAAWCIHRLEAGTNSFRELFPPPGAPDLELFQRQQTFFYRSALPSDWISRPEAEELKRMMWGRWLDREPLFFQECSSAVSGLDWGQVAAIGGHALRHGEAALQEAFATWLNDEVPPVLEAASYRMIPLDDNVVRVWAYSNYDPVDLPKSAIEALQHFDGRSTDDAISCAAGGNPPLSRDLVRTMCDFGILKPATSH